MKKILLVLMIPCFVLLTGCSKKVVLLNQDVSQAETAFDNFIKTTGYSYKVKDTENHIYNVLITEYNMQYLLQSKPMFSSNWGFSCKFSPIDTVHTLMYCKTYGNVGGIHDIRRHLKELRQNDIKYISYKKYMKQKREL